MSKTLVEMKNAALIEKKVTLYFFLGHSLIVKLI